jgi:hypothetical protein
MLPKGVIYLIHQFGLAILDEVWDNPRVIHTWDEDDKDTYGIANIEKKFDNSQLDSFLSALQGCNVPFDKLSPLVPAHTAWDSLIIYPANPSVSGTTITDFDVFTSLPLKNYDLPRDVFLAIGMMGVTIIDVDNKQPIQFYGPRISFIKSDNITKLANSKQNKDHAGTTTRTRRKSIEAATAVNPKKVTPCTPFAYMTPNGVDVPNADADEARVWIYGRGTADDCALIKSVARGVNINEVFEYYRNLFRNGQ